MSNHIGGNGGGGSGSSTARVKALTDGATINTNVSEAEIFTVTLHGNRTIANPTNPVNGKTIVYHLKQDTTGSRTVAWGNAFRFTAGTAPTLTVTKNYSDYVAFRYGAEDGFWDFAGSNLNLKGPLFEDDFDYTLGVLDGQGGWVDMGLGPDTVVKATGSGSINAPIPNIIGAGIYTAGCSKANAITGFNPNNPFRVEMDVVLHYTTGDRADCGILLGDINSTFLEFIVGQVNGVVVEWITGDGDKLAPATPLLPLETPITMTWVFDGTTETMKFDGVVINSYNPTLPRAVGSNDIVAYFDGDGQAIGESPFEFLAFRVYQ